MGLPHPLVKSGRSANISATTRSFLPACIRIPFTARGSRLGESYFELVQAGKESYYIVSQFDLFEYAQEAPFFARLASSFESCIYGLNLVRGELDRLPSLPS